MERKSSELMSGNALKVEVRIVLSFFVKLLLLQVEYLASYRMEVFSQKLV